MWRLSVNAAALVHLGTAAPHRPDDLLEDWDVLVGQDRAQQEVLEGFADGILKGEQVLISTDEAKRAGSSNAR